MPPGRVLRPDLACHRCGSDVYEEVGGGDFRFSCVNYWSGTGKKKCWTCASAEAWMIQRGEQLPLF